MSLTRIIGLLLLLLLVAMFMATSVQPPWFDWRAQALANAGKQRLLDAGLGQLEGQMVELSRVGLEPRRLRRLVKIRSYSPTPEQCGPAGVTKSGLHPQPDWHVALSSDLKENIPFGSKVRIPGLGWREVQDTTGRAARNTVDVMVPAGGKHIHGEMVVEFFLAED